ncbi:MAG TPA: NAD(P)-dependent oxidoreductase [Vicinamibacterales bacterium]|jgi:phosphoglycerate dehydrogenase-like enzyme|nr:NAD(P)-dependent oxidoreductase [Vicinamibacterales bacterium]
MSRIVIPDDEPAVMAPSAAFATLAGHEVRTYADRPSSVAELVRRIRDAEMVINIRSTSKFTADVLAACPHLRLISIWGTGTDNVDLLAAKSRGVRVTNTPGVSAVAVAEHTLALIMAVAKQIVTVDRQVRDGKWPRAMVPQLRGKVLGLIGTGAIGREVAKLGRAIGMRVVAWTFHPGGDTAEWIGFDDVFRQSDVVSIHVRQSTDTSGLIRREHFDMMKPGAIFINTARGPIVNEADLIAALATNRIAGAGLDVFDLEPLPPGSPLYSLPNVVLTPHAAGITPETTEAGLALAIDNVFAFLAGRPMNVVV